MSDATEEECYRAVQNATLAARALMNINIPAVLNEISRFDSFGPFFDPTGWIRLRKDSEEKKKLLEAALPLWKWVQSYTKED